MPGRDYGRQTPTTHEKCRQQWLSLAHEAPFPPQQMVVLPPPGATEQIRFVSFVQHCLLLLQSEPAACGLHRLHRLHRLRCCASASFDSAPSPTTATVDAATAPNADLRVVRRVLASPTSRVSESNRNPSMAASHLDDAPAPPGQRNAGRSDCSFHSVVSRRDAALSAVRMVPGSSLATALTFMVTPRP